MLNISTIYKVAAELSTTTPYGMTLHLFSYEDNMR